MDAVNKGRRNGVVVEFLDYLVLLNCVEGEVEVDESEPENFIDPGGNCLKNL